MTAVIYNDKIKCNLRLKAMEMSLINMITLLAQLILLMEYQICQHSKPRQDGT